MLEQYPPGRYRCLLLLVLGLQVGTSFSAGWERQWIDAFDGTGVDWESWTAQVQANYNAEAQCYTDDDSSADRNYDVSDGTLKIIARRQSINCPGLNGEFKAWTSGRLNSKDKREFLYGRIEARIRFHDLQGGTWPAFWMLENRIQEHPIANDNDFSPWPTPGAGEIDVWEWFSNGPDDYITNFFNASSCGREVRYTYPGGPADVLQWHDYAIEWEPDTIRFYVDDHLVVSHDVSGCAQYKEPMFVLLNVAMGGTLGGPIDSTLDTATMEVDYLAHCTATDSNTETRCNESTPIATDSGGGNDNGDGARPKDLVIFSDTESADWVAWDCCGGSSPRIVVDGDPRYAESMEFAIRGATVVGFTKRIPFTTGGGSHDASSIEGKGTLEFDLKVTSAPATLNWKLKVESVGVSSAVEVDLSSNIQGHGEPALNTWQRYSFSLSELARLGLDLSKIDLVMVFPAWGTGDGTVFRLDNLGIYTNEEQVAPVFTSTPPTEVVSRQAYRYQFEVADEDSDTWTVTAPVLPPWLNLDTGTGTLTGTPTDAEVGDHEVTLMVDDGEGSTRQSFTLRVVPRPGLNAAMIEVLFLILSE